MLREKCNKIFRIGYVCSELKSSDDMKLALKILKDNNQKISYNTQTYLERGEINNNIVNHLYRYDVTKYGSWVIMDCTKYLKDFKHPWLHVMCESFHSKVTLNELNDILKNDQKRLQSYKAMC